jgi:hypothetical protein
MEPPKRVDSITEEVIRKLYESRFCSSEKAYLICTPDFATELAHQIMHVENAWMRESKSRGKFDGPFENRIIEFYGMPVIRTLDVTRFKIMFTDENHRSIF